MSERTEPAGTQPTELVALAWYLEAGSRAFCAAGGDDRAASEPRLSGRERRICYAPTMEALPALVELPELRGRVRVFRDRADAGLASGFTMQVAVEALRRAGARTVRVAVPTGHLEAIERLARLVESVTCANVRGGGSFAVADAYRNWSDVSEEEVRRALSRIGGTPGHARAAGGPGRTR